MSKYKTHPVEYVAKSGKIVTINEPVEDTTFRDLLAENLQAWEGEEDSVQEEHRELIDRTRAALAGVTP